MSIEVACACGKRLKARDELAGRKAKCPGCGSTLSVPNPKLEDDLLYDLAPQDDSFAARAMGVAKPVAAAAATPAAARSAPIAPPTRAVATMPSARPMTTAAMAAALDGQSAAPGGLRRYLYFALVLTFLPLAWMTFGPQDDAGERFEQTLAHHPEIATQVEQALSSDDEDALFNALPDHRIEGAFLAHDTYAHWLFAGLAGLAFFGISLALFPAYRTSAKALVIVGIFTGTLGILFLLGVQLAAAATDGYYMTGRGLVVLFFYIVKFIGFSYSAALDPDTNFFISMFGFTFGVGMCEEICKALPLLYHYRSGKADLPWQGACLWGLISGVGFGVSEGITYSSDYYNGILAGDIYLVRFVSCVALHAVWAAACGIMIYKHQNLLQGAESFWGVMGNSVVLVLVPMVLHGLYDTLLKKEYDGLALLSAFVSFAWLAWQIESARKKFGDADAGGAVAYA